MIRINLLNRNESSHLWGNVFYTLFWITLIVIVGRLLFPKSTEILISLLVLSPFFILGLVILAAVAVAATALKTDAIEQLENEQTLLGGVIRNVSANQVWVLRNAWHSDLEDKKKGYTEKKEGWRVYIPKILHIDMGMVDLSPLPRDPEPIIVNTKDNQTATIDWRIETKVIDPTRFLVLVNGNREDFENQRASVVFNQLSSQKDQEDLTKFSQDELEELCTKARDTFNEGIAYLGIEAISLQIRKIMMPAEVQAAAEYRTVSKIRKEAAETKGGELSEIIRATGADPTRVVVFDSVRDILTNLIDPLANFLRTTQGRKEEKEASEK